VKPATNRLSYGTAKRYDKSFRTGNKIEDDDDSNKNSIDLLKCLTTAKRYE
jgi:hypothetical protein